MYEVEEVFSSNALGKCRFSRYRRDHKMIHAGNRVSAVFFIPEKFTVSVRVHVYGCSMQPADAG